ncbi:hypothetical protein E2C01_072975 [Portunus trituberculatus]|uniref:Uncharacterized protein n=1 Tax=Portunus trituberculatus TaxID=210409 RepID=A0A5B7IC45_PORTR|nr:hypothetical protein [Portunus trituberculatus]
MPAAACRGCPVVQRTSCVTAQLASHTPSPYSPALLLSCPPACLPSCLPTLLPARPPACLPSCLPALLPARPPTCPPSYLPACLPASLQ